MKTLYGKDSKGELRVWSIFTEGADVVVLHGKLGGKITEKRYAAEGKNQGRSNETTPEQQAVLEAEAKYTKQLKSGYFADKDDALGFQEFTPQKAHSHKEHSAKIKFPCICQPKLNGQRLMIDANGVAWSKQGEPLELPLHWTGVKELAIQLGGLDGEVYAGLESDGGLSLQRIISAFRKPNADTPKLGYWVYDIPINKPQAERWKLLESVTYTKPEAVTLILGKIAATEEDANSFYDMVVARKYEGVVYRNLDASYEFGKRSYAMQKRKPVETTEVKVLSVEKDKNGWGVMNCSTLEGVSVKCQMRVDAAEKNYRLYDNALELIDKVVEIEFETLSDAGVPLKPVGIRVRKVDQYGRPVE